MDTQNVTTGEEIEGRAVLLEASVAFGVPFNAAKHSRAQRPMLARAAAMFALYHLGWTLQRVGEELGGYHHTTVLHHREQHEIRLQQEPGYAERFMQFIGRLRSIHGIFLPGHLGKCLRREEKVSESHLDF